MGELALQLVWLAALYVCVRERAFPPLTLSIMWESWAGSSPAPTLGKSGPAPHLGSRAELALVAGVGDVCSRAAPRV